MGQGFENLTFGNNINTKHIPKNNNLISKCTKIYKTYAKCQAAARRLRPGPAEAPGPDRWIYFKSGNRNDRKSTRAMLFC